MKNRTWLGVAIALALLTLPAWAAIPSAQKIAKAVAETNETSGRGGALLLEVQLRIQGREGQPAAQGVIATHPTGLARLELKSSQGFVERHLLQSDAYQASRDGELLDEPHPFLPPVFLLQASSAEALRAALRSYGVSEQEVVLGRMGDRDCYVFGGRVMGSPEGEETLLPSLWVDIESLEPLRIVRNDGVEYRMGPPTLFDRIRVPTWVDIVDPDGLTARLEVTRAAPATAPAASFQSDWLTQPSLARPSSARGPAASTPEGLR